MKLQYFITLNIPMPGIPTDAVTAELNEACKRIGLLVPHSCAVVREIKARPKSEVLGSAELDPDGFSTPKPEFGLINRYFEFLCPTPLHLVLWLGAGSVLGFIASKLLIL